MAFPSLLTESQARSFLGQDWSSANSTVAINMAIGAASDLIQRYLQRVIPTQDYQAILTPRAGQWDKPEPDLISLDYFPIRSSSLNPVVTVRSGRTQALLINNNNTTTAQAAWFNTVTLGDPELSLLTNVGLTVTLVNNGITTSNSFPFFQTPLSTGFSVAASGSSGTLSAGTYLCAYSNVNAAGESVRSADVSVAVSSGESLVFTLPTLIPQAASRNVYVSTVGGITSTETKQNTSAITGTTYTVSSLIAGSSPQSVSYGTLSELATGINALGNGWYASTQQPTSFSAWPSSDVWASQGATVGCLANGQTQGLDVFASWVTGAQCDVESGTIYLPQGSTYYGQGPGQNYQWPGSSDWDATSSSWRDPVLVKYAAGWDTIPDVIVEATAVVVKTMLQELQTATQFESETADNWKATLAGIAERGLPASVRRMIAQYRAYRV
jgi:hypothetical protein